VSAAREYHRATNVPAHGTDEHEARTIVTRPVVFKDYGHAARVPIDAALAGPLLRDGAGVIRSQSRRDYGGGTIHWRAYSSAGALYPIEAYVAAPDGLFAFDPLGRELIRLREGDARDAAARAADAAADEFVVLTGIHARTGWKYLERGYRHVWWDAGTMLANLLALAAADGLKPRLLTAFADVELNAMLGVDGQSEYALAMLALGKGGGSNGAALSEPLASKAPSADFPMAEALHDASKLTGGEAVRAWRSAPAGDEPHLDGDQLRQAIRRRTSIRSYSRDALPLGELASLLEWAEAPIPADAPRVVRQVVAVAAVDGLEPGVYDAQLNLLHAREEAELRNAVGFAAMEQEHPRDAAVNVFQVADVEAVVERLGDRGYRWAQLEAGIRAGRVQIGAFARGWGAAASTFFDDEVSRELGTTDSPMLMVAVGPR
jgi:SagB-type dehydrogenase family enzyme